MASQDDISRWITTFIAERTGIPEDEIEPEENLGSYGLGSVQAVDLVGSLEDRFGLSLSPALVFQFPTVFELSVAIARRVAVAAPEV